MYSPVKFSDDRWTQYMTPLATPTPLDATEATKETRYSIPSGTYTGRTDTLFWLMFIGNNGGSVVEFERIQYNSGRILAELKSEVVESTRMGIKQFKALTGYAITNDQLQERRSTLQTQLPTMPNMFPLYAVHYATPIYVVDLEKHAVCVYDYVGNKGNSAPLPIILYKTGHRWSVELDASATVKSDAFDSFVVIHDLDTPLLAVGKYTKQQLIDMTQKLADAKNVPLDKEFKSKSKQDMYRDLVYYLSSSYKPDQK